MQDDTQQLIIGVHTHGGCQTDGGGANSGTAIDHSGLQNALDNPLGVCRPGLGFTYPGGRPELLDPAGGVALVVEVTGQNGGQPQPGTGMLHYDTGGGFLDTPMNEVSPNLYEAIFPPIQCGTVVHYYVSAETSSGLIVSDPVNAPTTTFSATSASALETIFEDNFESNQGWTVENINLADGQWDRGVPAGDGSRGDPTADFDGSGACFLTDNLAGNSDVDGGPTRLISPIIDLSGRESATLSYARWFFNDDLDIDRLDVHASSDGGSTWALIESVPHGSGWVERTIQLEDFIALTSQVRLRYSATDNPNDSVTEAGIDSVSIGTFSCGEATELTDITVTFGTHESGGLSQVQASDDDRYIARSRFSFASTGTHVAEVLIGAVTTDLDGALIDLTYEGRINQAGGTLRLRLRNWSTGSLQQVGQFVIGLTETSFTVNDVAASNRIRQTDGRIELSARISAVVTFSTNGFRGFTDFTDVTVE